MEKKILDALAEYLAYEDSYGDNPQLCINTANGDVEVMDEKEAEELEDKDSEHCDFYDVMDLLQMNPLDGSWLPNLDAVKEVATEY